MTSKWRDLDALLGLTVLLALPFAVYIAGGRGVAFVDAQDVFTYTLSSLTPVLLPIVILFFGVTHLQRSLSHRYLVYTRLRRNVAATLVEGAVRNAFRTAVAVMASIALAGVFAFLLAPHLVTFHSHAMTSLSPQDNSSNTFSFLLAWGWPTFVLVYSTYVGIIAALWSSLAYLILLQVHNPYLALGTPFLLYHGLNFLTGILGLPQYSPVSSLFPFNIVAFPVWTVTVPAMALLGAVILLGTKVYRGVHGLDKLA